MLIYRALGLETTASQDCPGTFVQPDYNTAHNQCFYSNREKGKEDMRMEGYKEVRRGAEQRVEREME